MNRVKFLFVLFFLLQYSTNLKAQKIQNHSDDLFLDQEIYFHYDKLVGNLSFQLDSDQLLENLKRETWDESSSSWTNDSLYDYSYNVLNLVDTIVSRKWEDGYHWTYKLRITYNYNSSSKIILKSFAHMLSGIWQDYGRINYSYSGQHISQLNYYSFLSNAWYLDGYRVYSWSTDNNLTSIVSYFIDPIFPNFYPPTWKDEFYYDSSNVLIMKTGLDYVGYCCWVNEINDLYFYDNNGNNNENIRQEWDSTDSLWINDYRYLYEYDFDNILLSTLYQDWQQDSLDWKNVWRETYNYTPQNQPSTMIRENWTPGSGWNSYVLRTYFYNTNYNWTEKLTQLWDGTNWKNYYRHLATWIEPVSVDQVQINIPNDFSLFQNYPNPFNPVTKIKFEIPSFTLRQAQSEIKVILKVYDILGNEIATLVNEEKPAGTYEVSFDGKGLSSGMYFYTLTAGSFSETKKMILLR